MWPDEATTMPELRDVVQQYDESAEALGQACTTELPPMNWPVFEE